MDYSSLTDETLLLLVARAQTEALNELYSRYNRLVFSLALHVVQSRPTAEEVTLDVFIRIWEKADTYQPERAAVRTWLTTITRNRALNAVRHRRARLDHQAIGWSELNAEPATEHHNPEDLASLAWQQRVVRRAVSQLPQEQQQALALAYFWGFSHREIAEHLGQPLGTVKTRIRSAIKKLRDLLAPLQT